MYIIPSHPPSLNSPYSNHPLPLHLISLVIFINKTFFSLPRKGSERNSESLLLFLFYGTEFCVVFYSAEGFRTEFRGFLFRGTAGIPAEITICSVYSVFRGIIFGSEIPNPRSTSFLQQNRA
jgi:hypothetical protein